jgi:hypothetical protein
MAQTITKKLQTAMFNVNTLRNGLQAGTVQLVEVQKKMSRGGRVQEPPRFALVYGGTILAIVITKPTNEDGSDRYTILPAAADAA